MSRKLFSSSRGRAAAPRTPSASSPRARCPEPSALRGPRRADARDDVFPLRVGKELAVEPLLARRRVAGERDARRRGLAAVAEDHRLDVDGGPPVVGDVVQACDTSSRALVVPRAEDRADRAPELLAAGPRESRLPVLRADDLLVRRDDLREVLRRQLGVRRDAARLALLRQRLLELVLAGLRRTTSPYIWRNRRRQSQREPLARDRGGEPLDGLRVQAEVQDRVHHPGHRGARAGAHGDEQRVGRVAEPPARSACSSLRERLRDLAFNAVQARAVRVLARRRRPRS